MALLHANPDYVLGRPKLDEIEIRFILDGNTLTAAVLSGLIDMAVGLGSVDRAIAVRDSWPGGEWPSASATTYTRRRDPPTGADT